MAITQNTYTGNGSLTTYSFTFPYLEETDIKVSLDGVDTSAYTLANATTINFNSAPANGVAIRIYRVTNTDSAQATFFAGSAIRAQDLNDNNLQVLYAVQETVNRSLDSTGGGLTGTLDMGGNKIINLGTPTADTDAATKKYIDDVVISGIGTGSAPRQLLQTNAAGTAVEFASDIDVPGTLDVTGATTLDSTLDVAGVATFTSDVSINSTGAITIPDGTNAERPTGVTGMIRFNTDLTEFEGYDGSAWGPLGGVQDVTVDQTSYAGTNPITVSEPTADNKQIDIASTSNAYGTRHVVSSTLPTSGDGNDGDIWYVI